MPAPDTITPPPRSARRATWIVLAILVSSAIFGLRWVSQPSQVAGLILHQVGNALDLEITASGASEYRLRGTPRLVLRDVVVRQPGAPTALLRAERIHFELPWSTIRARGADLTVKRVELDAPEIDVVALQHWLSTRPPSETRIPTLTDGVRIVRGRVIGNGWRADDLDFALPSLHPQKAASAQIRGRFTSGSTRVPFEVDVAMTRPAAGAGLGVSGDVAIESAPWKVPMQATLSGRLHNGDDGIGLDRLLLAAKARYRSGRADEPFVLGLAARLRVQSGELRFAPLGLAVRGQGTIPRLDGYGTFTFGNALAVRLQGRIESWPDAWPALPAPIGQSSSPMPFELGYRGRADLSDVTALQLHRDATAFDARFRLPQILDWIDSGARGSPLPPLSGRLATPRLDISGFVLEGVDIEIDDDTPTLP